MDLVKLHHSYFEPLPEDGLRLSQALANVATIPSSRTAIHHATSSPEQLQTGRHRTAA
jgi:hypothetical protein